MGVTAMIVKTVVVHDTALTVVDKAAARSVVGPRCAWNTVVLSHVAHYVLELTFALIAAVFRSAVPVVARQYVCITVKRLTAKTVVGRRSVPTGGKRITVDGVVAHSSVPTIGGEIFVKNVGALKFARTTDTVITARRAVDHRFVCMAAGNGCAKNVFLH